MSNEALLFFLLFSQHPHLEVQCYLSFDFVMFEYIVVHILFTLASLD